MASLRLNSSVFGHSPSTRDGSTRNRQRLAAPLLSVQKPNKAKSLRIQMKHLSDCLGLPSTAEWAASHNQHDPRNGQVGFPHHARLPWTAPVRSIAQSQDTDYLNFKLAPIISYSPPLTNQQCYSFWVFVQCDLPIMLQAVSLYHYPCLVILPSVGSLNG